MLSGMHTKRTCQICPTMYCSNTGVYVVVLWMGVGWY